MAAKMNLLLSFFLFVLIAMPASSSSRMILEEDQGVVPKCPKFKCLQIVCPEPRKVCPLIKCSSKGSYTPCCGCPRCCA
ncbi:hypothetical protein MKW94_025612 [Papaver nudicaule]|uniref:Uncharacterized protein n=1 Tax=Papaver nudicaule TaxID=74823 RepID=A0AA41SKS4_PAPNU|nr:hypothetical protein [Papaver nudicaule]